MTILLIFAAILFLTSIIILSVKGKDLPDWVLVSVILLPLIAGMLFGKWAYGIQEFNNKEYDFVTMTEGKTLNGRIIESDTIYVLTRKK